jgi:putative ubiquitin-RnfH superfamily antitoxin RatB of RatAB toxin-antitoxin module
VANGTPVRYQDRVDITELILSDHHEQRRMFAMLDDVDLSDSATLGSLWNRLSAMLEVHAQAEELYFYPELLKLGERLHDGAEIEETKDAIGDHNDIRDGITEAARHEVGTDGWWSGVKAAREANDEHMGEEEHEGLADFRRHATLDSRHRIAVTFARFEAEQVDGVPIRNKDPQQYVEDNS